MFTQGKKIEALIDKGFTEQQSELVRILSEAIKGASTSDVEELSEEDKKRAAYALNLCTVSISQIVDYNDLNILEQEYEGILNNLNLENFPKDEALLKVLKQILDTVTFFRIQEGDKVFIEREYEQKMKNAIWSAVPNFGLIVAGGNPYTMLISLASQVGIGYMNYRKQKAENGLEHDKQLWQLQKSAIEQFNALRRELFDTAWRLADRYGFKDSWRLTEKQISQYNAILMDTNVYRKFSRLEAIKDNFEAYPPFWYFFGHAALEIANGFKDVKSEESAYFISEAQKSFQKFIDIYVANNRQLLREDHLASANCLEYIGLLDSNKDRDTISNLLSIAIENAGNSMDIIQFCAFGYLKIGDKTNAEKYLKQLVIENYNAATNGQLLSYHYVCNRDKDEKRYSAEYGHLKHFVSERYLFPWSESKAIGDLNDDFLKQQRDILELKYNHVYEALKEKKVCLLNRKLQTPRDDTNYPDSYFGDDLFARKVRINDFERLRKTKKWNQYVDRLSQYDIENEYYDTLNSIATAINSLPEVDSNPKLIEDDLRYHSGALTGFSEKFMTGFELSDLKSFIGTLPVTVFLVDYERHLKTHFKWSVDDMKTMEIISEAERNLAALCNRESLPSPSDLFDKNELMENRGEVSVPETKYLLGRANESFRSFMDEQINIITGYKNIFNPSLLVKDEDGWSEFFSGKVSNDIRCRRKLLLAILHWKDSGTDYRDCLYFTARGLLYVVRGGFWGKDKLAEVPYTNAVVDESGNLIDRDSKAVIILKSYYPNVKELCEQLLTPLSRKC